MSTKYGHIKQYEKEILELKNQGLTHVLPQVVRTVQLGAVHLEYGGFGCFIFEFTLIMKNITPARFPPPNRKRNASI